MEFRDPKIERLAGLTAADRKWMDEIVKDVNETYVDDPTRPAGMQSVLPYMFPGVSDLLRSARSVLEEVMTT